MPDRDSMKGRGKQAIGKAQETAGKATGDRKTQAAGQRTQGEGKAQGAFGDVKEKVKGAVGKARGRR